jgi:tetratricopeptide (TPR) repeat protein
MVIIYCGSGLSAAKATTSPYFDQGTGYYQRGDYMAASAAFSWALRDTPNDANTHYYLANTLVKLGRMAEAQAHYGAAIRLSKDPQIKNYSQIALNGILKTGQTPYPVPALQMAPGGLNNTGMAQNSMGSPLAPQMAPGSGHTQGMPKAAFQMADSKARANQMIDQQADRTSAGMLLMGSGEAANAQRVGQWRAATARRQAAQTAQDMSAARLMKDVPAYTPEEIQAARQRGDIASLDAMQEANEKSKAAENYAKAQVWETQAAAKNLQEQLNAPLTPGGARLKAEGTNLYVRNFETPAPGPPMKAQPGKLEVVKPLTATPNSWGKNQGTSGGGKSSGSGAAVNTKSNSSVYGQVLPADK